MSWFSEHWLTLREAADTNARSTALLAPLGHWLQERSPGNDTTSGAINIVDLGCGTGSNLRWLAPRITKPQHWTLLDHDQELLAQAARTLGSPADLSQRYAERDVLQVENGVSATLACIDLYRQPAKLDGIHLLGASALLDLVSRRWLSSLVMRAAQHSVGLLFALNYDGRIRFTPRHPADAMIRDALNRDQLTDKGFGPALGPDCVTALHGVCLAHGYRIGQWRSDWHLGANHHALHLQLVDDFASIAERQTQSTSPEVATIRTWWHWRRAHIADSTLRVGHVDVLALPVKEYR